MVGWIKYWIFSGWLASVLQSVIVIVVIIVVMILGLSCVKNVIVNATQGTNVMFVKKQSEGYEDWWGKQASKAPKEGSVARGRTICPAAGKHNAYSVGSC